MKVLPSNGKARFESNFWKAEFRTDRQLSQNIFERVVTSGSRGVVCVIGPRRITLMDLEDDDDDDDDTESETE